MVAVCILSIDSDINWIVRYFKKSAIHIVCFSKILNKGRVGGRAGGRAGCGADYNV